ncbi:glycine-rich protein DOT1-like [Schistocerca americana]|uniref:glycine-rich protein DOT1-like n=1 Tax=Schistocerca americana TaxID=7009 RepID=UPI001F4F494C|nr:glycine-rich protein DOT1-like [Schistocerca americana]
MKGRENGNGVDELHVMVFVAAEMEVSHGGGGDKVGSEDGDGGAGDSGGVGGMDEKRRWWQRGQQLAHPSGQRRDDDGYRGGSVSPAGYSGDSSNGGGVEPHQGGSGGCGEYWAAAATASTGLWRLTEEWTDVWLAGWRRTDVRRQEALPKASTAP